MPSPLLLTIQHLRRQEEILLHGMLHPALEEDTTDLAAFLAEEYANEALNYPYTPPPFDREAALWGAKTLYTAAQLLLNRQHGAAELPALLPPFPHPLTEGAILSADLTLRFLPPIIAQLHRTDPDDALIPMLEEFLITWHYSGIGHALPAEKLNFEPLLGMFCLRQLYIDRVIELNNKALAAHEALSDSIKTILFTLHPSPFTQPKNDRR
ncbi:MAG: hypothetical protein WA004_05620 [Saprospiraceae bacterium]